MRIWTRVGFLPNFYITSGLRGTIILIIIKGEQLNLFCFVLSLFFGVNSCYPELGKFGFSPANPGVQTNFYHGEQPFIIESPRLT